MVIQTNGLSNGMKLALDWPGLALDLLGLAQIGQLTDFCFCEKWTSDWHGLVRIGLELAQDLSRLA